MRKEQQQSRTRNGKHPTKITRDTKMKMYIVLFALLLVFVPSSIAYAYLDPGTGAYLLQILVVAFAGILFAVKRYWDWIKAFFSSRSGKDEAGD